MKTLLLLVLAGILALGLISRAAEKPASTPEKTPIRLLLTVNGDPAKAKDLIAMAEALQNVKVTTAQMPQKADMLKPGLEKEFDALLMFDYQDKFSPEQKKNFLALLDTGIAVVSLHHNFQFSATWPEWRKVSGARWYIKEETVDGKTHPKVTWLGNQKIDVKVADPDHPITKGLKDFTLTDECFKNYDVSPDVHVLLTTDNPKNEKKICWTTTYGKSPVFFLMLGHDVKAYQDKNFQDVLARGLRWAVDQCQANKPAAKK